MSSSGFCDLWLRDVAFDTGTTTDATDRLFRFDQLGTFRRERSRGRSLPKNRDSRRERHNRLVRVS
jgi:hypothetical protein